MSDLSLNHVADYFAANLHLLGEGKSDHYLGVWSKDDIFFYFDVSQNFFDPDKATDLAHQYRQKSVYSLEERRNLGVDPPDDTGEA